MDLPDGHRVNAHSLFRHNPVYLPKRCRLACVEGKRFLTEAFPEHAGIQPDIPADAVFVHQIKRCPVSLRQSRDALPGEMQRSVCGALDIV